MLNKLGTIFGGLFILLFILNILNSIPFISIVVIGSLVMGLIFLYTSFNYLGAKFLQIFLLTAYGCIALFYNDGNSLVSLFCFYVSIELSGKYYSLKRIKYIVFGAIFITFSLLAKWSLFYIAGSILLYVTIASILYILNNDKV